MLHGGYLLVNSSLKDKGGFITIIPIIKGRNVVEETIEYNCCENGIEAVT